MRISSVGYFARTEEECKRLSKIVTEVTHDSTEAVCAAEAVALAIYLAKAGVSKAEIRSRLEEYYDLDFTPDEIRNDYMFDCTCDGSVPQAIICFLESDSFEDAIRNAVSLGGDSDTQAAIAGSIAGAFYGVPDKLAREAMASLPMET